MKQKILMTLVALFAMTTGAWAKVDLKNIVWKPGDTFDVGQVWILHQAPWPNQFIHTTGNTSVIPEFTFEDGVWILENFLNFDMYIYDGHLISVTRTDPAVFDIPEGKTEANQPIGFKIVSGEGTQESPYAFGLVYDPLEVTINDAKTEASFAMPAFDATVDYELVRDMTQSMTTQVGDGNDGYRIRIKKDNQTGKFVPAEMTPQAMAGLITVTDNIEQQTLTNVTDYTVSIFAVDDNDQPTGTAIAFADLEPGRYVAFATAADGSAYDGATEQSNVFVLFQGYEVTIPAGEYATYYKDEALYVDATEQPYAKLYTITDVSETTATVSELTVAPALTPILLQNTAQTTQTILLIPTTTTDVVNYYDGFKGTLVDQEMPASSETVDYYVCNGKEFFWVKDAGTIRANRCWLEIANSTTQGARSLAIVFGEATKITNTNFTNLTNGDWYDLNGRKLNAIPTKKGIYILNGRKVVIK